MKNLQVTIKLCSPAILAKNPLDGLLANLFFARQKEAGTFNGDYQQELKFIERDPDGFYHVSSPIFKVKSINNTTIMKSFDSKEYRDLFPKAKPPKAITNLSSGAFKSHIVKLEQLNVDEVVFFVRGDIDVIVELLGNLRFLGKKSSLGFGEVEKIIIKKIKDDRSVVSNGVLMRQVPINSKWLDKVSNKEDLGAKIDALSHPYWDKKRETYVVVNIGEENGL